MVLGGKPEVTGLLEHMTVLNANESFSLIPPIGTLAPQDCATFFFRGEDVTGQYLGSLYSMNGTALSITEPPFSVTFVTDSTFGGPDYGLFGQNLLPRINTEIEKYSSYSFVDFSTGSPQNLTLNGGIGDQPAAITTTAGLSGITIAGLSGIEGQTSLGWFAGIDDTEESINTYRESIYKYYTPQHISGQVNTFVASNGTVWMSFIVYSISDTLAYHQVLPYTQLFLVSSDFNLPDHYEDEKEFHLYFVSGEPVDVNFTATALDLGSYTLGFPGLSSGPANDIKFTDPGELLMYHITNFTVLFCGETGKMVMDILPSTLPTPIRGNPHPTVGSDMVSTHPNELFSSSNV